MGKAVHANADKTAPFPHYADRPAEGSGVGIPLCPIQGADEGSRKLAFGLSSIFSRPEDIAQKEHNADHLYLPQVNMALIFDLDRYRPVFLRPLDGSVRDVKSLRKALEEVDFNGILVLDRGFFSYDLAQLMSSKFIMPLRRNSSMADYSMKLNSSFVYRERGILCGFKDQEGLRLSGPEPYGG